MLALQIPNPENSVAPKNSVKQTGKSSASVETKMDWCAKAGQLLLLTDMSFTILSRMLLSAHYKSENKIQPYELP